MFKIAELDSLQSCDVGRFEHAQRNCLNGDWLVESTPEPDGRVCRRIGNRVTTLGLDPKSEIK